MEFLFVALGIGVTVVLAGVVYQRIGEARDARCFPPLGRMVDVGSGQLHMQAVGEGSPLVVFEAGMAASSLSWSLVQPEIAKAARTISYDRFGLGWSDAVPGPRDIEKVVGELHVLLEKAGADGPRILVGHSYGGLIARVYGERYPDKIVGMILLDPVAASEWSNPDPSHCKMLRSGILISRFCGVLARLGVIRLLMDRGSVVARMLPKRKTQSSNGSRGFAGLDRIVGEVKKLPRQFWPMVQSHWCETKCLEGMALYLKALPASAAAVANHAVNNIPLTVISAGNASAGQRREHEELARNSTRGRIEIVGNSGHWVHFDRPDVVICAIQEMVGVCAGQSAGAADTLMRRV